MTYRNFSWNRAERDFYTYFNDFVAYAAGDWTITTTEDGAGSATEALAAAQGGQLLITNDDADDDADFFQLVGESFKYVAGKKLSFVFRGKLSDAADSDFVAGLQITDTTPLAVSDGIFARKSDGDNTLQLVVCKDGTESVADMGELADATWFDFEISYEGANSRIEGYLNGARVCSVALTNAPDDEELTISFGVQNVEAAATTLHVDYIGASIER